MTRPSHVTKQLPALLAFSVIFILSLSPRLALAQASARHPASSSNLSATRPTNPLAIELYSTKVHFNNDGTGERQLDVRIRVENNEGAQQLRTLSFKYNAKFESFSLSFLRVKKADGTVIEAKPEILKDSPSGTPKDAPAYSDIHDVRISPPPLVPDDTLSYEVVARTMKPAAPGEFWYSHNFLSGTRASDEELRIEVPSDCAIHIHWDPKFAPAVTTEGPIKVYLWKRSGATGPAVTSTSEDELSKNVTPDISLTSFSDWTAIGKWLATQVQSANASSTELADKVQSLTTSAKTHLDKIQALYDFVSKQIRLVDVNPDETEYQLRDAAKVLSDGYGSAFDKSALLAAMLRSAGLHANVAFSPINGNLDPDFPTPAVLTHSMVAVASGKETVWLDPAEPTMPFRLLTPNLRGKQVLFASTAAPPHLAETPVDPPFLATQRVEINARVSSLGILSARIQYTLRGDNEYALRMAFYKTPKEQWKQVAQTMATLDGLRGEVVSVNPSDPTATRDPFVLQFNLVNPEYLDWSQKQFMLALPFPTFGMPEANASSAKPVALGSPLDVDVKLKLVLPVTDSAQVPAGAAVVRDYAEYHSSYNSQDNTVSAERTLRFVKGEVPAAGAVDYAAFAHAVQSDASQRIAVTNIIPDIPADAAPKDLMVAGGAALQSRRFSNALRLFRRVLELDPKQPGLLSGLGMAQLQLGQFSDAETSFRKQLEANPQDASANNLLGAALFDQKKYDDAAAAFEKQIALKPLDAAAHTSLGAVYLQQKKFSAAASEMEKAAALNPGDAGIQVRLGEAYLGLGDSQAALNAFDKADAASPSAPVQNEIAFSLAEHDVSLDRAEQIAKSALEKTESQLNSLNLNSVTLEQVQAMTSLAPIWDTLGWVYFHQGNLDKAETYIEPAWLLEERADVGSHLGQIYEKRGDKALAIRTYSLALAAGGAPSDTRDRLAKLIGKPEEVDSRVKPAKAELLRLHSIPLGKSTAGKSATFVVLLEPAPTGTRIQEVKSLSGDAGLEALGQRLRTAKFPRLFPPSSKAQIILRGSVTCSPRTLLCDFQYQPPSRLLAGR